MVQGRAAQLEFLVDLFKQSESFDESAIVRRVIDQAADPTGSPLAYMYFVDPPRKTIALAAWRDRSQPMATMVDAEPRPLARAACSRNASARGMRLRATISRASRNRTVCRICNAISQYR